MSKILNIIIIIYNMKLEDSPAFKMSFERINKCSITVVDNSIKDDIRLHNENIAKHYDIYYLTKYENIGLSKGYNFAIDTIKKERPETKWIITLDQDTILNKEYFDEVQEKIYSLNESSLYYPTVTSDIGIISPISMNKHLVKNDKDHTGKSSNIVAINSGLLIKIELFDTVKYDESMFLDMLDFDLFCQLIKKQQINKISNMECIIKQEFSGANFSTFENDYKRFKLYVSDFKTFCKKWKVNNVYTYYILLKRAIKLTIHYKTIKFLCEI